MNQRIKNALAAFLGQKFILTASSLLAVFVLLYLDKPVEKLELLVPGILAFYHGANVWQKREQLKAQANGTSNGAGGNNLGG